jgi:hypothetical protein
MERDTVGVEEEIRGWWIDGSMAANRCKKQKCVEDSRAIDSGRLCVFEEECRDLFKSWKLLVSSGTK